MEIYIKLFEVLFPVFFIVGIGFFLGKKNPNLNTSFITSYSANFGTPALIIFAVMTSGLSYNMFADYFIYWLVAMFFFAVVGILFLVFLKKDYSRELPPFILPNTGNMGIPICLFAYGTSGMGIAAAISSVIVLLHFTLNIFLASKKFDILVIIKSPSFYAILITVGFLYFEIEMPTFVLNTVMLLGYAMIVMILMSLGIALTQLKVFSLKNSIITSIGRVIFGPIIGYLIIKMFKTLRATEKANLNHSGRSYFGETMQLEGDLRSSGSVDVAGLVNGNVFVSDMTVTESGSIRGTLEATTVEINGHVEGKVSADTVIIGSSAVIKGDIFFKKTLKTEEGADIDGYIKRVNNGKSNSEEDIAIEEIVDRSEPLKPKVVPVAHHKEAV